MNGDLLGCVIKIPSRYNLPGQSWLTIAFECVSAQKSTWCALKESASTGFVFFESFSEKMPPINCTRRTHKNISKLEFLISHVNQQTGLGSISGPNYKITKYIHFYPQTNVNGWHSINTNLPADDIKSLLVKNYLMWLTYNKLIEEFVFAEL